MTTHAYAATAADKPLTPLNITRREVTAEDVAIDILYCGVCHSDIHTARNEWGRTTYPIVPGHEIVGRVTHIGEKVSRFSVGDLVGVGVMVDSCRSCPACHDNEEQYCENGMIQTYGGRDKHTGEPTQGGYAKDIVVAQDYVLSVADTLDAAAVAPLLCAGITTWSPLRHWNVKKGDKVGVIGLGGLGHMGIKFAVALGAEVTMVTRSPDKGEDAKKLGVTDVLLSTDGQAMKRARNKFDFLLNTIPVGHDLNPYLSLLKRNGTMVIVGAIEMLKPTHGGLLISNRRQVAGSAIGGIKETQEMLDFCAEHNITCDIEMIKMEDINTAYDRVVDGDVRYRFVIDMENFQS